MELLLLIVSVTIVGQESDRTLDGKGDEATLTSPHGATKTSVGRIFLSSPIDCSLKSVSSVQLVAPSITCATTLSQVLSPSGCTSTSAHPTVDEFNMKTSPMASTSVFISYSLKNFDNYRSYLLQLW